MSEIHDTPNPEDRPQDQQDQAAAAAPDVAAPETAGDTEEAAAGTVEAMVAEWKAELEGQQSVSASNVQDRLLDLWGQLPEGTIRSEIEKWLTETVQRQLYAVADIDARLQRVLADA